MVWLSGSLVSSGDSRVKKLQKQEISSPYHLCPKQSPEQVLRICNKYEELFIPTPTSQSIDWCFRPLDCPCIYTTLSLVQFRQSLPVCLPTVQAFPGFNLSPITVSNTTTLPLRSISRYFDHFMLCDSIRSSSRTGSLQSHVSTILP